jgi:hypothetical protein
MRDLIRNSKSHVMSLVERFGLKETYVIAAKAFVSRWEVWRKSAGVVSDEKAKIASLRCVNASVVLRRVAVEIELKEQPQRVDPGETTILEVCNVEDGYVAWSNTDLTEGRGHQIPLAVCQKEATAIRMGRKKSVQGSDCRVSKCLIFRLVDGGLVHYGPIRFTPSTKGDDEVQAKIDSRNAAMARAKKLGMSDEEIDALVATTS